MSNAVSHQMRRIVSERLQKMRLVGNQTWICHKFIFNVLPSHVCSPSTDSMESSDNESIDMPEIINLRQRDSRGLTVLHLNVNSLQNKLEEVKILIDDIKAQVVFLTETKTDSSYPNSQFKLEGYNMYRNDRAKGGGGVMAYFSSKLPSKS